MLQGIDIKQVMFLAAIYKPNDERLKSDPPADAEMNISAGADPVLDLDALRKARWQDYYLDILNVTLRMDGQAGHMSRVLGKYSKGNVVSFDHEIEQIADVWHYLNMSPPGTLIAGWRIESIMALLIGKAMQYNIAISDRFKVNPVANYPSTSHLMRVEMIYQQTVRDVHYRPLPTLDDLRVWWDIPVPASSVPCMHDADLLKLTQAEWSEYGFAAMENQLYVQEQVVQRYYGYTR